MNARATAFAGIAGLIVFGTSFGIFRTFSPRPIDYGTLDYSSFTGEEIGLLFVVSASCAACSDPQLPAAWERAKSAAAYLATERGARLSIAGLGLDARPDVAMTFLSQFGEFHEIAVGRHWQNMGARGFLFEELGSPAATPQLVLFSRKIEVGFDGRPIISSQVVEQRRIGVTAIAAWADQMGLQDGP